MKKKRTFTPEFKSKVAIEALRERDTIHEISKKYQVHPTQVSEWKKALQQGAGSVFERSGSKDDETLKQKIKEDRLFRQIGHLQVQVDFLKDACDKSGIGIPTDELDQLR